MKPLDLSNFLEGRCCIKIERSEAYDRVLEALDQRDIRWCMGERPQEYKPKPEFPYLKYDPFVKGLHCTNDMYMGNVPILEAADIIAEQNISFDDIDSLLGRE